MTWLLVGLGNPGTRYEKSRHNTGFMVVDAFARRHGIVFRRKEGGAATGEGVVAGQSVVVAKPQTYVNRSGKAVERLLETREIAPDRLVVVHDDLDLPLGIIRIRNSGGHGGHHGVESIIASLGRDDFIRVKVGIGRPDDVGDVIVYVLDDFPAHQRAAAAEWFQQASEALDEIVAAGVVSAMNRYNHPQAERR